MAQATSDIPEGIKDKSLPIKIAKNTIFSSLAGAVLTAAYESTRGSAKASRVYEAEQAKKPRTALGGQQLHPYRHPVGLLAGSAALNSGIVAFCFFSVREYFISPALATYSRYHAREKVSQENEQKESNLTWTAMRIQNVPDTAITGAILGSSYNAWRRGIVGIPAGAITATLMCTLIQLVVNEASIFRVRYVSRRLQPPAEATIVPSTSSSSSPENILSSPPSGSIPRNPTPSLPHESSPTHSAPPSESSSLSERILGLIGVKKMSDEEYLERLRKRRDGYLERIEEIERQEQQRREEDS